MMEENSDEQILLECEVILTVIFAREHNGLFVETLNDIRNLLPKLRKRTEEIVRNQKIFAQEQRLNEQNDRHGYSTHVDTRKLF